MNLDNWGAPVSCSTKESLAAWNTAWVNAMHFIGDPFLDLAEANATDDAFAMGSVFCGAYRILGGSPFDAPELLLDVERARNRATTDRERDHLEALQHLVRGDFTRAAKRWDERAADANDFAAVRFAHDIYLHVGDAGRRVRSSQRALDHWQPDAPGWGFIAGQHAFALEEVGLLDEAEALGQRALDLDPLDLWALHALAHVYETLADNDAAIELLEGRRAVWETQDGLSVHIWWHLALRMIASGRFDEVLDIHDRQLAVATTPFRLCDLTSILWRLELAGVNVGERWDVVANRFAGRPERHTSGFLDLHAALVYTRCPSHPEADVFFDGLASSHTGESENDQIFVGIVQPLVDAIRHGEVRPADSVRILDGLDDRLHRIGGSIAQRDIVALTKNRYQETAMEAS